MLPVDPVDLTTSLPFGPVSYYLHIFVGLIGWFAAIGAIISRKGSPSHIWSGRIFILSLVIVVVANFFMLAVRLSPPLLLAGIVCLYAMAGGYLALKKPSRAVVVSEYLLFLVQMLILTVFLANAIPLAVADKIPVYGLVLLLIVPVILLVADIHFFLNHRQRAKLRLRRHLSRMAWAIVVAVRAPLTEVYINLGISELAVVTLPLLIAPILILGFWKRASGSK